MKKTSIILTSLLAACLLFVSWNKARKATGAVHIGMDFCYVLDGNKVIQVADKDNVVITPSGNGHYKCKAKDLPNNSRKGVQWDFSNTGYLCGVDYGVDGQEGVTDDWQNTVSATGNVTLQCHLH